MELFELTTPRLRALCGLFGIGMLSTLVWCLCRLIQYVHPPMPAPTALEAVGASALAAITAMLITGHE